MADLTLSGLQVKPLVWDKGTSTPFGTALYAYRIRGPFPDGRWKSMSPNRGWSDHPTKDDAVAACNAEHAASIAEMIEVVA